MFLPKYSPDLNPIEQVFATKPCCERPERELRSRFPSLRPNLPISERYHCARSATTRANSTAARTRQHVTASPVVPTHKVGLDGVLTEQHRHRIVDMSGRNVPVRVHALQSLNQSLFECVDHYRQWLACARLGDSCRLPFAHDPANNPECAWVQATARGFWVRPLVSPSVRRAAWTASDLQRPSPYTARRMASRSPVGARIASVP